MNPLWFHWFCVVFFLWVSPVLAIEIARHILSYSLKSFLRSDIRAYPWYNQLGIFNAVNETIQSADYGISRMYYDLYWPVKLVSFCILVPCSLLKKLWKEAIFVYVESFCNPIQIEEE